MQLICLRTYEYSISLQYWYHAEKADGQALVCRGEGSLNARKLVNKTDNCTFHFDNKGQFSYYHHHVSWERIEKKETKEDDYYQLIWIMHVMIWFNVENGEPPARKRHWIKDWQELFFLMMKHHHIMVMVIIIINSSAMWSTVAVVSMFGCMHLSSYI